MPVHPWSEPDQLKNSTNNQYCRGNSSQIKINQFIYITHGVHHKGEHRVYVIQNV